MREVDEEIREIKKEIIESRGLSIKTNNLVSALGADIKSIAKRQAGYERRFNWNSGVAYTIFAVLTFAGLKLMSDARIGEIRSEITVLEERVKELETDLSEETRRASERASSEKKAERYYALIRQQKRSEVVAQYPAMSKEQLSPAEAAAFQDTYQQFRLDLSVAAYHSGLELARAGRHKDALKKFESALELSSDASHTPAVRFEIARTLRRLKRNGEALVVARRVADQQVDPSLHPDAWWLVAKCAQADKDLDTARDALKTLIRKWPRSSYAKDARSLLRDLTRQAILGKKAAATAQPPAQ